MSEAPELTGDEALAAEHALGVLSADERRAAEARVAADPAFAALVEAWRARLAPLADEVAPISPPERTWRGVERLLPANDEAGLARSVRLWRRAALGGFGLAAAGVAAAVVLALQPPRVITVQPPVPGPMLNASLASDTGHPMFVAAYDPERRMLIVTSLVPPGTDPAHVHQLWLIPRDGKPRSLGMVEPGRSKGMPMAGMAPMVGEGAALAVSVEPPGGSPSKSGPTGPVAAQGRLQRI